MTTLKILSAGAVKRGVARIAAAFEQETGAKVAIEFTPVPELRRRVAAGETADVIVATPAVLDEIAAQGKIVAASRGYIGRSRMGVVIHADATMPSISDTESFKKLLLGASHVVRNEASSGIYSEKLLNKLGLTAQLGEKIVVVNTGSAIMEYVAAHPAQAVGLAQISELMVMMDKGCKVKLAAPLPDDIQNMTSYDAAAMAGAPAAATALAQLFASAEAKNIFAETGIS
ncbi:MAG: substrate-binding domain-containing protein [Betaproteobacteria bacterium]|jgi:molybdate transport system substrate-binding protein|nr:substrate-binding domain-containing protein [Betaproteobacteria bacterium]MDH5341477.1 substrate-binding domain-containing protein [Betaproteobacteria bacterium]